MENIFTESEIMRIMDNDWKRYKAGEIKYNQSRWTKDESGKSKRETTMAYYGESFDDALIREAAENQ